MQESLLILVILAFALACGIFLVMDGMTNQNRWVAGSGLAMATLGVVGAGIVMNTHPGMITLK